MFTGIIESAGIVKGTARRGEDVLLSISTSMGLGDIKVGDSVAVSGACLTVVEVMDGSFSADVSAETLAKTTLKALKIGDRVNLEKALKLNAFLGGHFVLGHVDCVKSRAGISYKKVLLRWTVSALLSINMKKTDFMLILFLTPLGRQRLGQRRQATRSMWRQTSWENMWNDSSIPTGESMRIFCRSMDFLNNDVREK